MHAMCYIFYLQTCNLISCNGDDVVHMFHIHVCYTEQVMGVKNLRLIVVGYKHVIVIHRERSGQKSRTQYVLL